MALALCASFAWTAGCGGGDGDAPAGGANNGGGNAGGNGGGGNAAVSCDTTLFQAGTVAAPSAAQLATYAGTYVGDEGSFGPNPGDPFSRSGAATLVLGSDGSVTYNGAAITARSICRDAAAQAGGAFWLYVHSDLGHMDLTDGGEAFGVALDDGVEVVQNGRKQ
jgi:hypothetical protein